MDPWQLLERDILFILNIIFVVYFNYVLAGFDSHLSALFDFSHVSFSNQTLFHQTNNSNSVYTKKYNISQ